MMFPSFSRKALNCSSFHRTLEFSFCVCVCHNLLKLLLSTLFLSLNVRIRFTLTVINNIAVIQNFYLIPVILTRAPGRITKISLSCNSRQFNPHFIPRFELPFSPFVLADVTLWHHACPYTLWLRKKKFLLEALDTVIIRLSLLAFCPWTWPLLSVQLSWIYGIWAAQANQSPDCSETSQTPGIPSTHLRFCKTKRERRAEGSQQVSGASLYDSSGEEK